MISVQKHWLRKSKKQLGKRVIKIQDVCYLLKVSVRREAGLCRWANGNKMWRRSSLPKSAKMWIYESWEAGSQKRSNCALFDLALEAPILGIACKYRTFVQLTLLECFFFLQTESISEHPMVTQLIKFSTINVVLCANGNHITAGSRPPALLSYSSSSISHSGISSGAQKNSPRNDTSAVSHTHFEYIVKMREEVIQINTNL